MQRDSSDSSFRNKTAEKKPSVLQKVFSVKEIIFQENKPPFFKLRVPSPILNPLL